MSAKIDTFCDYSKCFGRNLHLFPFHHPEYDGIRLPLPARRPPEKVSWRTKVLADWFSKQEAVPGLFVNDEKTLGENIGDNGGIQVAYRAFENRMKHYL